MTTHSAILSNLDMQRDRLGASRPGARVVRAVRSSGWLWSILRFTLVIGVLAGLLYGYRMWVISQAGRGARKGMGVKISGLGGLGGLGSGARAFGGGLYDDGKRF